MKFSKTVALALAAGVIASAAYAEEEASKVGAYAGTVLKNGYLSNGYLFADETVLQSYAGVTYAGFDLNVWNSWAPDDNSYARSPASEIDYELDYSNSIGDFEYTLGVAAWCYPHSDDSFDEWVGITKISYNGISDIVTPGLYARFGLESQQGCYGQFRLSKGFELADKLALDLYALVGYASKSWRAGKGEDDDGFVDFEARATLTYTICDNASVNAGCQYSSVIDSTLRDFEDKQADGDMDHFIYFAGLDVWF